MFYRDETRSKKNSVRTIATVSSSYPNLNEAIAAHALVGHLPAESRVAQIGRTYPLKKTVNGFLKIGQEPECLHWVWFSPADRRVFVCPWRGDRRRRPTRRASPGSPADGSSSGGAAAASRRVFCARSTRRDRCPNGSRSADPADPVVRKVLSVRAVLSGRLDLADLVDRAHLPHRRRIHQVHWLSPALPSLFFS